MIRRFKLWRRRRRARSTNKGAFALREFVYLDEVSVTSLLSSRLGALPSEFTDSLTDTTTAELSSELAASVGVIKPQIASRLESTQTQNRQVVRKATIQATFKDLYDRERDSLVLRPITDDDVVPRQEDSRSAVASPADWLHLQPWLVDSETLKRGRLAEVEVELQADPLFRVSTIVSTYADIVKDSDVLASQVDQEGLRQISEVNRLLAKLMVGLVPIRCRVVDFSVITVGNEDYLIHRTVLNQIPPSERPPVKLVYLVGVAEQGLFWKDIRRVLFSKARVRVLCRLNDVSLADSWTPVKLVNVLGEVAPSLAREMEMFGSGALQAMADGNRTQEQLVAPGFSTLVIYGNLLAQHYGVVLGDADRSRLGTLAGENADSLLSVPESRVGFRAIAEFVDERFTGEIDPEIAVRLRMDARQQAGLSVTAPATQPAPMPGQNLQGPEDCRFLDTEIIAIYW